MLTRIVSKIGKEGATGLLVIVLIALIGPPAASGVPGREGNQDRQALAPNEQDRSAGWPASDIATESYVVDATGEEGAPWATSKQMYESSVSAILKDLYREVEKAYLAVGLTKEEVQRLLAVQQQVAQGVTSDRWQAYQKAWPAIVKARETAAERLASLGPGAVPVILRAEDETGERRGRDLFVQALTMIGVRAVPTLIDGLSYPARNIRIRAASSLGAIRDPRAVEPLIQALSDHDQMVVRTAAQALGPFKDARAVEPLLRLWEENGPVDRPSLAVVLGQIGDRRAVTPIMAALEDRLGEAEKTGNWSANGWDMGVYIHALGRIGDGRAIPLLRKTLLAGPQRDKAGVSKYDVADAAAEALRSLGLQVAGDEEKGGYRVIETDQVLETGRDAADVVGPEEISGAATTWNHATVRFPVDSTSMYLDWIAAEPNDSSVVQEVETLLISRDYTYVVDTKDMVSGQMAQKRIVWAVYPSLERGGKTGFHFELVARTGSTAVPFPNAGAAVTDEPGERHLHWIVNDPCAPRHFGQFETKTQETVGGLEIRRECTPLGGGRARFTISVRADRPLLIRVWDLKSRVQIEPESIEPRTHRLSDNGVLFFDYGEDITELDSTIQYRFIASGLHEGSLFYPMTNALFRLNVPGNGFPKGPIRQVQSSIWGFAFDLKSDLPFKVSRVQRWEYTCYELKALSVERK